MAASVRTGRRGPRRRRADRGDDARGGSPDVGPAAVRGRRDGPRRGRAEPGPRVWPASVARPGSGSTRSWAATAPWPVNACHSAWPATRSRGRWSSQPRRSPPARSAASSWSAPMTAFGRACLRSTSPAAAAGSIADTPDVIRGRHDRRLGHARLRASGRSRDAGRPRCLDASSRRKRVGAPGRSPRRPPTTDSVARSRRRSSGTTTGRRLAVQSCGEIACRTRVLDPDGGIDGVPRGS